MVFHSSFVHVHTSFFAKLGGLVELKVLLTERKLFIANVLFFASKRKMMRCVSFKEGEPAQKKTAIARSP